MTFKDHPRKPAKRGQQGSASIETNFEIEDVTQLIQRYKGNVSKTADAMGVGSLSLERWIKKEPRLKEEVDSQRLRWIELVEESVLQRAVEANDTALQTFVLRTQGRKRGWDPNEGAREVAKDIASEAFNFILDKSKSPVKK